MLMTPAEAAEKLKLSVYTIRRMIHDGRIPASRMGTGTHARLRIDEADLQAFIENSKTQHGESLSTS